MMESDGDGVDWSTVANELKVNGVSSIAHYTNLTVTIH